MVLSSRSATGVTPLAGLLGITPPEPGIVSFKAAHRAAPRASRSGRTPLYAMAARAVWPCEPNLVENLRRWVVSGLSADQPTGGGFQPGVQSSSVESCPMPVYRLTKDAITELPKATYAERGVKERADLQRLLKANIGVVAPPPSDVLVISEEFGEWEDSKRRIDLLGIDRDASLVVIELKRDDEGGHMELQAIRYAAMVSRMTFQRAVKTYQAYLDKSGAGGDARSTILEFLRTSEPPRDDAVLDVRIVLVAADFAKELTTAVLWLNEWELDIRCVKVKPYSDGDGTILEVQQVVPLPEAAEYQVSIREEAISRREVARESGEPTGYWFMNTGDGSNEGRSWEDCRKYGFMLAGRREVDPRRPEAQGRRQALRVPERARVRRARGRHGRGRADEGLRPGRAEQAHPRVASDRASPARPHERPGPRRLVHRGPVDPGCGQGQCRAQEPRAAEHTRADQEVGAGRRSAEAVWGERQRGLSTSQAQSWRRPSREWPSWMQAFRACAYIGSLPCPQRA